ncbi:MAG: glycosyltransferase family 4 protein [Candidatus Hodarchaeota archaeon]
MKILFISDVPLNQPSSGSEKMLGWQATELSRRGLDVFAITRQHNLQDYIVRDVSGVTEASYYGSPQNFFRFIFSLLKYPVKFYRRFVQSSTFNVAISHQPFNSFILLITTKLKRLPLLYNFHSPAHEEYLLVNENKSELRNFFPSKLRMLIENYCVKRAQKVMVESLYMKQKVVDIHRFPADKIIVNPGGVNIHRYQPFECRELIKKNLDFPSGKTHILTVRNLEARMGLDNLIRAIYLLKRNSVKVHLVIGGEGPERQKLQNLIEDHGLAKEISMRGFIPQEQLPMYYAAADFFVIPTRDLEGFGLVTLESLACGTPVLGTPIGGTKEILSGFDSQFLFNGVSPEAIAQGIQAAIVGFFNNAEQYNELRLRCRKYAETNYSWQRHIDQLEELIDEIQ